MRGKGVERNIYITPKGLQILAQLDRGEYKTLSTSAARRRAAARNRPQKRPAEGKR